MQFILDYIKYYDYKKLIFPFIVLLLITSEFIYLNNKINDKRTNNTIENIIIKEEKNIISTQTDEFIYIDVKGAVSNPGVYKINKNSRVIDAVNMSGGFLKTANTEYTNLSKKLNDSDIIKIYTKEEINEAFKEEKIEVINPCICEPCICKNTEEIKNEEKTKININTATLEELDSLDGIGESKAKSIIEYRQKNGKFNNIEEIKNVSGISESLFEKIKNSITT